MPSLRRRADDGAGRRWEILNQREELAPGPGVEGGVEPLGQLLEGEPPVDMGLLEPGADDVPIGVGGKGGVALGIADGHVRRCEAIRS